ncbi:hypothetical protein Ct61P_09439 [Colletotrichum tofieldiae]|nr:hypothetical protein Ct61P_09439 [Colletotrichum tofieldiae]
MNVFKLQSAAFSAAFIDKQTGDRAANAKYVPTLINLWAAVENTNGGSHNFQAGTRAGSDVKPQIYSIGGDNGVRDRLIPSMTGLPRHAQPQYECEEGGGAQATQ